MFKSFAAKELMTVMEPVRNEVMATAIVTRLTNRHSWSVDSKHSGRALGSLSLIGCARVADSGSDASAAIAMWVSSNNWKKKERYKDQEEFMVKKEFSGERCSGLKRNYSSRNCFHEACLPAF
jgi:hypothetical protein